MQVTIDKLVKEFEARLNGTTFVSIQAETKVKLNKFTTGAKPLKSGNLNPYLNRVWKRQHVSGMVGMDHQAWLNRMAELNGVEGRESMERSNGVAWGEKHAFVAPFETPDVPNKIRFCSLNKATNVEYYLVDTGETIEIATFAEWLPPPPKQEFADGRDWSERDFLLRRIREIKAFGQVYELPANPELAIPEIAPEAAEAAAPVSVPV